MKQAIGIVVVAIVTFYLLIDRSEDFNWDELSGKNVLVTGASSGIGEQIAYTLARHGANVVITARREQQLKKVISRCKEISPNGKFFHLVADMGDMTSAEDVIDVSASWLGGIDMIILNHALIPDFNTWLGTKDNLTSHDKILDVNYRSFVYLASHALTYLEKTNGCIGAVGSIAGRLPTPWSISYSASKYALDGFFSSLRWEWLRRGFNVSATYCVIGRIDTEKASTVLEGLFNDYSLDKSTFDKQVPAGSPESTAAAIVRATYSRERELYYPSNQNLFLTSLLRLLWPGLLEKISDAFHSK